MHKNDGVTIVSKQKCDIVGRVPDTLWKTEKYFIAKMQKPLMGDPVVLIYDETCEWDLYMPYNKKIDDRIFGDEVKVYVRACFRKDGMFYIDEIIEEQDW